MDTATRDRWALHYAIALETGDLDAARPALDAAAADALLAETLTEIDRQWADEHGPAVPVRLARDLLDTPADPLDEAPTVGSVARDLASGPHRGPYLSQLLGSTAPLPGALTAPAVGRLLTGVAGTPPTPRFRSAFRNAALDAVMRHEARLAESHDRALLAAARTPRRPTP
jgi:hypothetical protein